MPSRSATKASEARNEVKCRHLIEARRRCPGPRRSPGISYVAINQCVLGGPQRLHLLPLVLRSLFACRVSRPSEILATFDQAQDRALPFQKLSGSVAPGP